MGFRAVGDRGKSDSERKEGTYGRNSASLPDGSSLIVEPFPCAVPGTKMSSSVGVPVYDGGPAS